MGYPSDVKWKYYLKDEIKEYQIFEDIMLSEINQSQKDNHSTMPPM